MTARRESRIGNGSTELNDIDFAEGAQALGTALAVGLLVGLERGWRDRELPEGGRVAGLRTFALIGLLGGVLTVLQPAPGLLLPAGLLTVVTLFAVSYRRASEAGGTLSITTAAAALTTFGLGALAARGHAILAVGTAVILALLLDLKPALHDWLRRVQPAELTAVLQLGVLTVVVLPLLPDAGYGPYAALNPYKLWIAVILIAGLSLVGHLATRFRGGKQGLMWTGLLGGLASSTAATIALARAVRLQPAWHASAAAAIVAACGVMFLRMAVVVAILQPSLARQVSVFLVELAVAAFAVAGWQWQHQPATGETGVPAAQRLFDLPSALGFGVALAVVALGARWASDAFGAVGMYAVAFVSGLADVDAILISSAQMLAEGQLSPATAARAIMLAVVANMLTKSVLASAIAGRAVGARVARGYLIVSLLGLIAAAIQTR